MYFEDFIKERTGLSYPLSPDDDFDGYYRKAVGLMGGPAAFRKYIPFTDDALRQSLAMDPNFNTDLTPIRRWDDAAGIRIPDGQLGPQRPFRTDGGIWPLLVANGVTGIALSQAVCLLKAAAEMAIATEPMSVPAP